MAEETRPAASHSRTARGRDSHGSVYFATRRTAQRPSIYREISVLRSHQWRTARNSAGYLIEHLQPGTSLLDVGCGPGTITADLAALVTPGRVTAIEVSAEALGEAHRAVAGRGLGNVEFAVADVHALDYPDDSFDVVHAHQVLQHVADPVAALREMRRVCKPGGIVAARDADHAAMTWYPQVPALDEWLSVYCRTARRNGGEPDAGRRLLSWAQQAGFARISSTASTWCYATDEERTCQFHLDGMREDGLSVPEPSAVGALTIEAA